MKNSIGPIYFLANLGGALLIFYFAHSIVVFAKAEQRVYFDASDSITFLANTWLIFIASFLLNVFWLVRALIRIFKHRDSHPLVWFGSTIVVWAATFVAIRLGSNLA